MEVDEKEKAIAKEKNLRSAADKADSLNKAQPKKKFTYKEKLEYENLEKDIAKLEEEKALLTDKLSSGNGDHIQIKDWAFRMQQIISEVEEKSMRWLELSELGI